MEWLSYRTYMSIEYRQGYSDLLVVKQTGGSF
jgi:hypothetical protein